MAFVCSELTYKTGMQNNAGDIAHDHKLYAMPNILWFCSLFATMSLETIECNSSLWVLILGQS